MAMSEAHRALLRTNRVMLVRDLEVNDALFAVLIAEDLFSESNCQDILSRSTRSAQAAAFLDAVPRKGEDAWPALIKGLIHSKQSVIAKQLDPTLTQHIKANLDSQRSPTCSQPIVTQETRPSGGAKLCSQPEDTESAIMTGTISGMKLFCTSNSEAKRILEGVKSGDNYNLSKRCRGRALIINNSLFTGGGLSLREGAQFDSLNLCELFNSLFFETVLEENLTAKEMISLLKQEKGRPEHKDADAFVLWILSHGANGVVYGSDGEAVDIDKDVVQMFNGKACPNLLDTPKVILIQACQGKDQTEGVIQSDSLTEEQETDLSAPMKNLSIGDTQDPLRQIKIHKLADMLIAYATCPGFKSYRQTNMGTWFVRAFVKEVCGRADREHLEEILTKVRKSIVETKRTNPMHYDKPHHMQLTESRSRLLKSLYLFPGYAKRK